MSSMYQIFFAYFFTAKRINSTDAWDNSYKCKLDCFRGKALLQSMNSVQRRTMTLLLKE